MTPSLPPRTHTNSSTALDTCKAPCQLQRLTSRMQTANVYFPLAIGNMREMFQTFYAKIIVY